MARDEDERRVGEILSAVIGNVVAVPVVLGYVALGGVIIVGRSLVDIVGHRGKRRLRGDRPARRARHTAAGRPR